MKVAVSILSSNYSEEETIEKINKTDAEYIHVDVMDGHFVDNVTNFEYLNESEKPLDVHLMVSRPFEYISKYSQFNKTDAIVIHAELEDNLNDLLDYIKSLGLKCGLAISPETSLDALEPYYEKIDEVLVMTVKPGYGGQAMIESVLDKIEELFHIRKEKNLNFRIVVDGGVNGDTINKVGLADIVVSGSFICKSENYQSRINKLRLSKNVKKC